MRPGRRRMRSPRDRAAQGRRASAPRCWLVLVALGAALAPRLAAAAPADLADLHPRWIAVHFSGVEEPVLAWLEPGPAPGLARVSVPAATVETVLLAAEHPVPGTFSDFVWIFDVATGHVRRADVSGRVLHDVDWGIASVSAEVDLRIHLDTRRAAGFEPPRRIFGRRVRAYCTSPGDCTPVEPRPYRPETGEVLAVGSACARWHGLRTVAFAPLGDVRMAELDDRRQTALPTPPPPDGLHAGAVSETSSAADSCS